MRRMKLNASNAAYELRQRYGAATDLKDEYGSLASRADGLIESTGRELKKARLELGRLYVPELSESAFKRAATLAGFNGFARRNPFDAMAREKHALEHAVARIERDPRYAKRELLVGPQGELHRELAEAQDMLKPWLAECRKFEDHDEFSTLLEAKYDTPEFKGKWWTPEYWKLWAAGDRICAALGMKDFGDDVLPAYQKVSEQREFWQSEVRRIDSHIAAVHDLVKQHDEAQRAIVELPQTMLTQAQQVVGDFAASADLALLEQWAQAEDGDSDAQRRLVIALRKVAGLTAKRQYLTGMRTAFRAEAKSFDVRAEKYLRKSLKFERKDPNMPVDEQVFDFKFRKKHGKYKSELAKSGLYADRIENYKAYEHFALANDPRLWWYEFTADAPPRYLAELRGWYHAQGKVKPAHADWDEVAAAPQVIAAMGMLDTRGEEDERYLS